MQKPLFILLPVWGQTYCQNFLNYGLASLLGQSCFDNGKKMPRLELVFLTDSSSDPVIQEHPRTRLFADRARVSTILIDDLVPAEPNLYGFALTTAYFRGIREVRARVNNAAFMFVVADYIFSRNLLVSVLEKLDGGNRVVYSVGLRCDADGLLFSLHPYLGKDQTCKITERQAVSLALQWLHISTKAKIRNSNNAVASSNYQHLIYRIDENTLYLRCFMLHMLMIDPELVPEYVPGFCDYSFVPAMASSGPAALIADSDQGVVLEAQNSPFHELAFTGIKKQEPGCMAAEIMGWCTEYKAGLAGYSFLFHCSNLPSNTEKFIQSANEEIKKILAYIKGNFTNGPFNHFHWQSGIRGYIQSLNGLRPDEVALPYNSVGNIIDHGNKKEKNLSRIQQLIQSIKLKCHQKDFQYIRDLIRNFSDSLNANVVFILRPDFFTQNFLEDNQSGYMIESTMFEQPAAGLTAEHGYERQSFAGAVVLLRTTEILLFNKIILGLRRVLPYGSRVLVIFVKNFYEDTDRDYRLLASLPQNQISINNIECFGTIERLESGNRLIEALRTLYRNRHRPARILSAGLRLVGALAGFLRHAGLPGNGPADADSAQTAIVLDGSFQPCLADDLVERKKPAATIVREHKPCLFSMMVWGERYIRVFLQGGLPSQMTQGNLLSDRFRGSDYKIYTDACSAEQIRAHALVQRLSKHLNVQFIDIGRVLARSEQENKSKWNAVRHVHRQSVIAAEETNSALFFLCSDQLWTGYSFTKAIGRIDSGYSAVLCPGPRAQEGAVLPFLRQRYLAAHGQSFTFDADTLVDVCAGNLHPEMREWIWPDSAYFKAPTYVMFEIENTGLLAYCFSLHPVCIDTVVRGQTDFNIFDQDFLTRALPDINQIYLSADSRDIFHFEVSPGSQGPAMAPDFVRQCEDRIRAMVWYAEGTFNHYQRAFFRHPFRMYRHAGREEEWRRTEAAAAKIQAAISRYLSLDDASLAARFPEAFRRRQEKFGTSLQKPVSEPHACRKAS